MSIGGGFSRQDHKELGEGRATNEPNQKRCTPLRGESQCEGGIGAL